MYTHSPFNVAQSQAAQIFWGWAVRFVIVALCFWQSRNLLDIWSHSPYDKSGGWAFLIWLMPLVRVWRDRAQPVPSALPMWLALGCCALSVLLDMHVVAYVALAFSIVGLRCWDWISWIWFVGAVSWMNIIGYAMSNFGWAPWVSDLIRFSIVLAVSLTVLGFDMKAVKRE